MRVLVAPDTFSATLSAVDAADAIALGWSRHAPHDELDLAPMADGGTQFVEVLHAGLGGDLLAVTASGPHGDPVPGTVLVVGERAFVSSAQACGLHLAPAGERDPERATTRGLGELVLAAVGSGAREIVVGVGGSATSDGGAGLLAALGARAEPAGALEGGALGLGALGRVDLGPARDLLDGVHLVLASDEDNPLLGLFGATRSGGAQRGLAEDRLYAVETALDRLAAATDRRVALAPGAGAGGGLGFALLLLGAVRSPAVDVVAGAVGLADRARRADLVVTGEGSFDFSSRSGTVPYAVAGIAAAAVRPCVALAGRVLVGSREMRALGVESAYAVDDLVGEQEGARDPAGSLAALAERVARSWSR